MRSRAQCQREEKSSSRAREMQQMKEMVVELHKRGWRAKQMV